MGRSCLVYTCVALLAACDTFPPTEIEDAEGRLDADDPFCEMHLSDLTATIELDGVGQVELTLPPTAGEWGRGTAVYWEEDQRDVTCKFPGGALGVRIQYDTTPIGKPDCDECSARYRGLYIEGMTFAGGPNQCESGPYCEYADCRPVEPTSAKSFSLWCYSLEDSLP